MKPNTDLAIYLVHALCGAAFVITAWILKVADPEPPASAVPAAVVSEPTVAPWSRTLLAIHMVAFGVMYFGVGNAVIPDRVPDWFPGQRIVGAIVMLAATALVIAARVAFKTWRFRAKLDEGHQLATGGPFSTIRHPIYMGLNLFALGTALWVPTGIVWAGFVLMVIGSDLRARTEDALLAKAFGATYQDYRARTRRFIPGIY